MANYMKNIIYFWINYYILSVVKSLTQEFEKQE